MLLSAAIAWLHLLAATVWVGSQIFLIVAVIPAIHTIEDANTRVNTIRVLTDRYNVVGWASLAILVLTGLARSYNVVPAMSLLLTTWYGQVLLVKVGMVACILVLTALHALHIGPRLLALSSTAAQDPTPEYLRMRRLSLITSTLTLGLSLGVLTAAVLLRIAPF